MDSSCVAEPGVIKRARPKEEVRGPDELLPSKRTHQALGTGNFSQGGYYDGEFVSFFDGPGAAWRCIYPLSSQANDDDPPSATTFHS